MARRLGITSNIKGYFSIALGGEAPYIPAFLMAGQTYARLGEEGQAADVLKAGIAAAKRAGTPDALHALGEMQALLATVE